MYIPDIYQNDRDEKLNKKKFTLTVTRQERNFHCTKQNGKNTIKKNSILTEICELVLKRLNGIYAEFIHTF